MSNKTSPDSTYLLLQQLVRALDEKKVGDLRVLKVSAKSTITDYLVLATGNSEPHLRALRIEVERVLDENKQPIAGMDVGGYGSGWIVVDAYQIMAHIFTPEQRANYALEKLWKDAEVLDVATLIAIPKKAAAKKALAAKKTAAVKKTVAVKKAAPAKKVVKKTVKKATRPAVTTKVTKVAVPKKVTKAAAPKKKTVTAVKKTAKKAVRPAKKK